MVRGPCALERRSGNAAGAQWLHDGRRCRRQYGASGFSVRPDHEHFHGRFEPPHWAILPDHRHARQWHSGYALRGRPRQRARHRGPDAGDFYSGWRRGLECAKDSPVQLFLLSLDIPPPRWRSFHRWAAEAGPPVRPNGHADRRQPGRAVQPDFVAARREYGWYCRFTAAQAAALRTTYADSVCQRARRATTGEWIDLSVVSP